jgi:DNA-binding protein YbaB
MKLGVLFLIAGLVGSAAAFSLTTRTDSCSNCRSLTRRGMFGGAGAGVPSEDNPEEMKKMEEAAKQMGMSLAEYKLAISARVRLAEQLNSARVKGGKDGTVSVERDGNNPPKHLEITITEAGKALGKDALSAELITALKAASDASRVKRTEAQKGMMTYIGDEMKKLS